MALSEKSRTAIYQHMSSVLGEEATAEMLSYFPARDVEEPATKELLLLTRAELHTDIAEVRVEIEKLRSETRSEIGTLRSKIERLRGDTRGDIEALRADMHQSLQRSMFATIAVMVTIGGVLLSAMALFQT
jgi:hypothetical protein